MSLEFIIQGIVQVGVPIMISGLVIYFIFLIGNILTEYLRITLDKQSKTNEMNFNVDRLSPVLVEDIQIKERMIKLLYKLNADRVLIFYYHNGGTGFHGIGKSKVSIISEVLNHGTNSVLKELSNLPISFTYMWNKRVIKNEKFLLEDIESIKDSDVSMYNHLKERNVKSMYSIGWYSENGIPKGFINVSFCKKQKFLSTAEIEEIEKFVYTLN